MTEPLYADDPDVHVVYPITDATGQSVDFDPVVHVDEDGPTITGQWLGAPGPSRDLKVPLISLQAGFMYFLRLAVPDDADIELGYVILE